MGYYIGRWLWWVGAILIWGCAIISCIAVGGFALAFIADKFGDAPAIIALGVCVLAAFLTILEYERCS